APALRTAESAAKTTSAVLIHPPRRTRGNLPRAARLRLAAGREAARERSVSPSPARCGRPKFSSAALLVREKARSVEREACAGLRVAQRKTRPNRRRRRHQWLAADPWRQDGGDNSILRSREAYFGVRESSRISPPHVNGQSTPCGDPFSSYLPPFSAVVAVVNLQLLNARLSSIRAIPTTRDRWIRHFQPMFPQAAPSPTSSTD